MAKVQVSVQGSEGASSSQQSALQVVLNQVDQAIHSQPRFSRATVGSEWDHIKVQCLLQEAHPDARAVIMDMQVAGPLPALIWFDCSSFILLQITSHSL